MINLIPKIQLHFHDRYIFHACRRDGRAGCCWSQGCGQDNGDNWTLQEKIAFRLNHVCAAFDAHVISGRDGLGFTINDLRFAIGLPPDKL
jgi:hypothetical protein